MRPIRLALPLCLLLGPGLASAQAQGQSYPIPAPPRVPPAPPPAPRPPPPPELIAAWRAAQEGERLVVAGRMEEAIAHFRRTVESSIEDREIYFLESIHLRALALGLIYAGRRDEADRELAWFLDRARPEPRLANAEAVVRLLDMRLYIHAGRGDIEQVLALLDARGAFAGTPQARCPAGPYFPIVVAPAHHDPRVAAKLRALGCWDSIIAQLDELAARPIGGSRFDALPPRPAQSPAPAR